MNATLEQSQRELPRLLALASQGEEVLITVEGRAVAKLTALPQPKRSRQDVEQWLGELDRLRARTATGKAGLTVEEILEEDRGDEPA
jgi:antitoxin (DNA-binding transcriptional repressor) of toxin-antitoxin stability system